MAEKSLKTLIIGVMLNTKHNISFVLRICFYFQPCEGDSEIVLELRKARASEVCTAFVENKVLSSTEYDGTGDRYSFSGYSVFIFVRSV